MDVIEKIKPFFGETRARVYLLWAILLGVGFTVTHYYQVQKINTLWIVISVIGLGYMYKVMPLRDRQMKRIFYSWLIPLTFGMVVSVAMFYVDSLVKYTPDLGVIWLFILAAGYFLNSLADSSPKTWYWVAAVLHIVAGVLCVVFSEFSRVQYLLAAIVSVWSMVNLWLLRST